MTDPQNYGFAKLVPGFDFLQNLIRGTNESLPQMPSLSTWVAPTLNVEELEKRIQELRAVHFWLEQNSKALGATIQALEVQKMTLATLKGMNCSMADLARSMQLKPECAPAADTAPSAAAPAASAGVAGVVDPMQWWGSLTQQFQHIAASAMQDAAQKSADSARAMASHTAAADEGAGSTTAAKPRRKPATRKPPARARE